MANIPLLHEVLIIEDMMLKEHLLPNIYAWVLCLGFSVLLTRALLGGGRLNAPTQVFRG